MVLQAGFYNMDCMDGMRQFPDGFFDLAIVDPPYGDAGSEFARGGGYGLDRGSNGTWSRFGGWFNRYKQVEPICGRDNLSKIHGGG